MKRYITLLGLCLVCALNLHAQESSEYFYSPKFAVKSNLLYDATATINLGIETKIGKKYTLDIPVSYNPWTFSDCKKIKHLLIQPEVRYWLFDRLNGHFFGLHAHYAQFNVAGFKMLGLRNKRYEGDLYGGGISYGYHWILNKRWSLEGTVGVGYAYIDYDKRLCVGCEKKVKDTHRNYFGPTKVALNLVYIIK